MLRFHTAACYVLALGFVFATLMFANTLAIVTGAAGVTLCLAWSAYFAHLWRQYS